MLPDPGWLLVASSTLRDPHFARSLLVVLEADAAGSLAVVLDRPTSLAVTEVLAPWEPLVSDPAVFFNGGPVDRDSALALGTLRSDQPPPGWRPLTPTLGLVYLDTPPESASGLLADLRLYAGYAGWGPGQLDAEIAEGSWHVVPSSPADLFSPSPELLWRDVLRRQRAPLSLLVTLPEDPNLN